MFGMARTSRGDSLTTFRSKNLTRVDAAELTLGFEELHRMGEAIEAERLRWLGEVERRRLARNEGYLSTKAWLADRFRVAPGAASQQVKVAGCPFGDAERLGALLLRAGLLLGGARSDHGQG